MDRSKPRVLIGCARSGVLGRAFRALGWIAWECDTEPTRDSENARWHLTGDALHAARSAPWDACIMHPPCRFLSVSGLHWNKRQPWRAAQTDKAAQFFMDCVEAVSSIGRGLVENPTGCMSTRYRKADQIVQPWQFGDDASKATGFWLYGMAPLVIDPSAAFPPRYVCKDCGKNTQGWAGACAACGGVRVAERWSNQTDSGQNRLGPSDDRAEKRAQTYPGIARAIALAVTAAKGTRHE